MHITAETPSGAVTEQLFTIPSPQGDIPGALWAPTAAAPTPGPLILLGHGGGQHKMAPGMVARAHRLVTECGYAAAAIDAPGHGDRPRTEEHTRYIAEIRTRIQSGGNISPVLTDFHAHLATQTVPEWQATLDALQQLPHVGTGPAGYWGMSMGCALGVPFIAAAPRIRAAVLGLNGAETSPEAAARITIPIEFLIQWDDEMVPRAAALALFDAFPSPEKTLHVNPGKHGDLPRHEIDSALLFFTRHLT